MPFLKPRKISYTKSRINVCKRYGLRHAVFTPVLSSKKRYTGEWKDDRKHGKGSEFHESLHTKTRLLYEGDWSNDLKHGYGELFGMLPDKSRVKIYSGNWINDKKQGFGGLWDDNGGYYEGDFSDNDRHGFGRLWQKDGTFYQGTWKNDLYHGEGMLVHADGNRFEGHFSRGKKEGQGTFYHIRSGQLQDGFWLADKCVVSTIEDIYWRQSAVTPTSYPIPKNHLSNINAVVEARLNEASMLRDPESSSFSANYQDYARENVDCQ